MLYLKETITKLLVSLSCSIFTFSRRYPLSYVYSGYYYWGNGNLNGQDSLGYWWSTAAYSDSRAYSLAMSSSHLDPQDNSSEALGFALRCVSYSTCIPSVSAFVCAFRSGTMGWRRTDT